MGVSFIYITTDSIKPEKPPLDFHIPQRKNIDLFMFIYSINLYQFFDLFMFIYSINLYQLIDLFMFIYSINLYQFIDLYSINFHVHILH